MAYARPGKSQISRQLARESRSAPRPGCDAMNCSLMRIQPRSSLRCARPSVFPRPHSKKPTMENNAADALSLLRKAAFHESGHAIGCLAAGVPVELVQIVGTP